MTTAQVTLSESEIQILQALSASRGKSEEEILREAVRQFLAQHQIENRRDALRQARGIWRERRDLPDFTALRNEWNRF